jgi:hypothetical protein
LAGRFLPKEGGSCGTSLELHFGKEGFHVVGRVEECSQVAGEGLGRGDGDADEVVVVVMGEEYRVRGCVWCGSIPHKRNVVKLAGVAINVKNYS